jgi:type II secretory pathway pseudopilin PulG
MIKNEKGFLLIECVVAAVIICVALTAIAYGLQTSIRGTQALNNQTTAYYLAQQQMATLRQYESLGTYDAGNAVWTTATNYLDPNTAATYTTTTSVLPQAQVPYPGNKFPTYIIPVRTTVQWTGVNQLPGSLQIDTYYYY